jgi:hypothetical protein
MQGDLKRGNAAFRMRGIGLSVAVLASATLSLSAPDRALATGVHAATTTVTTSGGAGGGGGTLGCAGGSSASTLHGLPVASSGRVVQTGAHAARTEAHARTAATRTASAGVHLHAFGHGHRA